MVDPSFVFNDFNELRTFIASSYRITNINDVPRFGIPSRRGRFGGVVCALSIIPRSHLFEGEQPGQVARPAAAPPVRDPTILRPRTDRTTTLSYRNHPGG